MTSMGQIGETIQTPRELAFEWKINNFFSLLDEAAHFYRSHSFSFEDLQWQLELYPRSIFLEESAAIYLNREDSGPPKTVKYWLGIKVPGGVEKKKEYEGQFSSVKNWYAYNLSRSELSDRKSTLMPNNVLTLICCLRSNSHIAAKSTPTYADQAVQAALDGEKNCLKSFSSLLESAEDSDIIIKVQGKEFPAHRAVLRSRSAVFHSMFAHEMVEKSSRVVKIEDSDPTVFQDFLIHIYSGRCDHISVKNVCGLYATADKYDFADLKKACSDFMKNQIDVGCFCDILTLAMKHNDKDLIECATNFFCDNTIEIVKTTEWQIFLADNPTVGNELFLKAMSNSAKTISNLLNASKK